MKNPALILTYNNLALTKQCVESVLAQDVETQVCIVDNGSTDGTKEWAVENRYGLFYFGSNAGVSIGWNNGLQLIFKSLDFPHALVIGSDTVLPPWFYKTLLLAPFQFVTGAPVDRMEEIAEIPKSLSFTDNPCFSAFLIHKEAWQKIGPFDENMQLYVQDVDYHIRGARLGIRLVNSGLPFYHQSGGSQTIKQAHPYIRQQLNLRADADREEFRLKWGVNLQAGESYEHLFNASSPVPSASHEPARPL